MHIRLSVAALFLAFAPAAFGQEGGQRYALLVGVAQYAPEMENLRFTENDVEQLAEVLQKKPKPYAKVVVMTAARGQKDAELMPTAANIRKQLDKLAMKCVKDDVLLVALSGHGFDAKGKGSFCGHKAKQSDTETLLPLDEVYSVLGKSPAGLKALIVDACRVDSSKGRPLESAKEIKYNSDEQVTTGPPPPAGVVILFSCSQRESSFESDELRLGVFFDSVIKGMAGAAARPGEGSVSWASLAAYTQSGVQDYSKKSGRTQKPHFKGDTNSALALIVLPPGSRALREDFRRIKLGEVPKGWERDDAIGVRPYKGVPCLEADTKGNHSVTTPKVRIEGDFLMEVVFQLGMKNKLQLTLQAKDGDPDLELIVQGPEGVPLSGEQTKVKLAEIEAKAELKSSQDRISPKPSRLRLEREGTTFRLIVDGETLIARPFKDYKEFESLKIGLTMDQTGGTRDHVTRVFAISVGPRPMSKKKD